MDDSCRDGVKLKTDTDALSLDTVGSTLPLLSLHSRERPKILEIALNMQEQMLRRRTKGMMELFGTQYLPAQLIDISTSRIRAVKKVRHVLKSPPDLKRRT